MIYRLLNTMITGGAVSFSLSLSFYDRRLFFFFVGVCVCVFRCLHPSSTLNERNERPTAENGRP